MEAGERDLRGAGEIEVVGFERVDVRALGREEPGAVHRLVTYEHGRDERSVAVRRSGVEGEAVERHRDECRVACDVPEARAREARGPLHLESTDLGVLRAWRPGLTDTPDLDRILVGRTVGRRGVGRVRYLGDQLVPLGFGGRESRLCGLQRLLHLAELGELLRRRLALQLQPVAQLLDLRQELAPACVGGEQQVEALRRAFSGERGAEAVGVGAGCAKIDHLRELEKGFEQLSHPLFAHGWADEARNRLDALVGVLDSNAVAPRDQVEVVLAVADRDRPFSCEPEPLRQNLERGGLRDALGRELEEERQRLRHEEPPGELLSHRDPELVQRRRFPDADELRRRLLEPRSELADHVQRDPLERRVALGLRRRALHVQLVVDVDVEPEAGRLDGRDCLAREPELDRMVEDPRPVRLDDRGTLVADERLGRARRLEHAPGRLHHPARADDDADARVARPPHRLERPRAQHVVVRDQRPVQISRHDLDVAGEIVGELQARGP